MASLSALAPALAFGLFARAAVVEEITRLHPVAVERVVAPRSVDEVRALVRRHRGPVSIGGGRFSMGGQTATEDALQLDMRAMTRVLELSPEKRTIRVEAGATWRSIQDAIDPHDLSLKIMQSYANFTVGGSLSVNVHGRYVNQGPLIRSVRAIKLVLADGSLAEASPTKNRELFYGAIGGYGGLGVIVEAELELEPNERVERTHVELPASEYPAWFAANIKGSKDAVFHNADLLPPLFEKATAVTFSRTERPVTRKRRLQPRRRLGMLGRVVAWTISELPGGPLLRERVLQPLWLIGKPVVYRNYEASYDAYGLEPTTRRFSTYVLQEYFVPVGRFHEFVPKMREIFRRYGVNVLNVSIRHAEKDPGALLAWAREECFAFVVYYKQGTAPHDRTLVGVWTRELIEAALASGGTYYLPYQPHARPDQFHRAYPRAKEWFALKKRVDPGYKFRNKLWDAYFPPPKRAPFVSKVKVKRPYARTFLTLPEWYIVYSADEYAAWSQKRLPSGFPYFRAVAQYWRLYADASRAARDLAGDPGGFGDHAMLLTIGASFTAEYLLKGAYEATLGRLFEPREPSLEDAFASQVAAEYARFIHDVPWYEFPFGAKLRELWTLHGPWSLRRLERRAAYSTELAAKAAWAKAIKLATGAAYAPEDLTLEARIAGGGSVPRLVEGGEALERLSDGTRLVRLPRYEKFTKAVPRLAASGARFVELAGNGRVALTVRAPAAWDGARLWGDVFAEWPVLTEPGRKRVAFAVAVRDLSDVVSDLPEQGAQFDHVYDY